MQSSRCSSPTQLPQSSIIGTTGFLRKRITTFFKARVPCRGRDASKGIIILSIGSSGDTWREMVYSGNLKENFLDQKEKLIYIYISWRQSISAEKYETWETSICTQHSECSIKRSDNLLIVPKAYTIRKWWFHTQLLFEHSPSCVGIINGLTYGFLTF